MRLSVITSEIAEDFEEAAAILKAKGFSDMDICNVNGKSVDLFTEEDADHVKRIAEKNGMRIVNIASYAFMYAPLYENYVFQEEEWNGHFHGNAEKQLRHIRKLAGLAKRLGAENIRLFPFRWPENRTLVGTEEDRERIAGFMKQAASIAEQENVSLVLENCPYTHCPKGLMTKDIVERTGSPNLKMLWDPANSYRADRHRVPPEFLGASLREELLECLPYIGYVHVKDYHYDPEAEGKKFRHEALGKGDIDFREIAEILREKKDGCMLSIEPEVMTREEILESLRYYREVFG